MNRIVIIQCSKRKNPGPDKARYLYYGARFEKMMKCAVFFKPQAIFILSCKYGLLDLDDEIEYYDCFLGTKTKPQRQKWATDVLNQLTERADLNSDEFIMLAAWLYIEYLTPSLKFYETPFKGLRQGEQLQYLSQCNG